MLPTMRRGWAWSRESRVIGFSVGEPSALGAEGAEPLFDRLASS